jgi:amino acid permease
VKKQPLLENKDIPNPEFTPKEKEAMKKPASPKAKGKAEAKPAAETEAIAEPVGKGTFASSVFLLFSSAVGAGVLALPYCFLVGGVVPTAISIVFFACITGLSSTAIVACQEASKSRDYQTIVKKYLGETASSVMSAIIATYCLLNCVGALVIIADQSGAVLTHFFGKQDVWWMDRSAHVVIGAVLAFPLMCLKEITSLKFTSMLSLAGSMFIIGCVVQQTIVHPAEELEQDYGPIAYFPPSVASLLLALPSSCLAYQNQMQVPNIYAELRPELKNVKKMSMIIATSILCIILPMYLITAFAGYFMFRSQTPTDVLVGPYAPTETQIFAARLLLCVNAVFRVPVNHFTARSALYTLYTRYSGKQPVAGETTFSGNVFWVEVLTYSAIMAGLGMLLKSLAIVLDIMSATCAMAVMFFIPGLFLIKGMKESQSYGKWKALAYVFFCVGGSIAVVSLWDVFNGS